jgi:tetratricopeptide (TPR) repeat protein
VSYFFGTLRRVDQSGSASSPARSCASFLTFLIGAALSSSCAREIQTTSISPPAPVPAVRTAMMRQATNAAEAGDGDLELRRLRQFLAANPQNPDAPVLLARYYEARGYPDLALEHYRLAAAQFPQSQTIAIALAKTLRSMGEPAEAVRTLQEFAARQPKPGWEVLSLEGILQDEQGRHSAAESAHRAAISAAPERSDLHNNLGYNLLTQGRPDAAIAEFQRAIELDPKSEIAHNNLATALARSGSREAIAEWSKSTGQAEAHNNMAAVLIEQGRYQEARAELAAALSIEPGLSAALANLRLVAEKDGKPITIPARASTASDHRSVLAKLFGRRTESKPPEPASQDNTPTASAQAASAPADPSLKK